MSKFEPLSPGSLTAHPSTKKGNGSGWRDILAPSEFGPYFVGECLKEHAPVFIAAPDMQAALECVAALEMDPEEAYHVLHRHGITAEHEKSMKSIKAWVSAKVRAALTLSKEECE